MNHETAHPCDQQPVMAQRRRWLRRLAWACAVLMFVILGLSAHMRLTRVGLGCEPWPQCYGQAGQADVQAGASPTNTVAIALVRMAHRILASAVLLLILAILALALSLRPAAPARMIMVCTLLSLALFLAVLGRWAGASLLPAVTLGNLLGGMILFALCVRLALTIDAADARPHGSAAARAGVALAIALTLAQVTLGGLVSSGHAGLSCPAFGACDLNAGTWQALHIWTAPAIGLPPDHPGGAGIHLLHRALGLVLTVLLLGLSVYAWRQGSRRQACLLTILPLALVALGLALVASGLPLPMVLAHTLGAALLLAVLSGVRMPIRRP